MVSNRREDHENSMLAPHLLQNCMVYINTLMLQQVSDGFIFKYQIARALIARLNTFCNKREVLKRPAA
jgi:TnpA family transposase